ncbi:MAG: FAD:protein FMN transferase [Bacillota bacterium]
MRETRSIMGMPVVLEIVGGAPSSEYDGVFSFLREVDERFSTYKEGSEVSRINRGEIEPDAYSSELTEILERAEETKRITGGYFDVYTPDGTLDPSGLVKGWAIQRAAELLRSRGLDQFYLEIAGDIQTSGMNRDGKEWSIGIRNPFASEEVVKVVYPHGRGVATSGTYVRGAHIYDPHAGTTASDAFVSLTVIGPNVYEADRLATAAFAMGERGIEFLERFGGCEAYAITPSGTAVMTSGFEAYTSL